MNEVVDVPVDFKDQPVNVDLIKSIMSKIKCTPPPWATKETDELLFKRIKRM